MDTGTDTRRATATATSEPIGRSGPWTSDVVKQRHESKIHVELLVAVEQGSTRVVRHKIKLQLLKSAEHHDILQDTESGFAADACQLEAMAVQV